MARLTAGRGPARRNGGRRGTTGTSGREVHLPGAGPRPRMDDHAAGAERPDRRRGGPDGAAGGAGAAERLGERVIADPDPATKFI